MKRADLKRAGKSIGQRINQLAASAVLVATLILAGVVALFQLNDSVQARRSALEATGFVYASAAAEALAARDIDGLQSVLKSVGRLGDIIGVYAIGQDDAVIISMGQQTLLSSQILKGTPSTLNMLQSGALPVSVDVVRSGERVGRLVLIGDISNIRQRLAHTLLATFLSALAALTVALVYARRLQRRLTGPIVQLTQSMQKLHAAHRYETTIIPHAEGETHELALSFNGMISEIKARDEALQRLAYFDPLTGLANRASFQKHVGEQNVESLKEGASLGIFLLSIENFQAIVDTLGSVVGDAVVLSAAAQLRSVAGDKAFLARISVDEFGIVAPGTTTLEDAQQALAPFVASLYQPLSILGHSIHVNVAAGIAVSDLHRDRHVDLPRQAQLALAAAKRDGGNRVQAFKPEFSERLKEEVEIEKGLRLALASDGLEVHFQPIVTAATGRVDGFEALMRWRNGPAGLVSPVKFIPIAEKTGLITEMGFWILRRSCEHAQAWIDLGLRPRQVSVNVSPGQLMVAGFIETLRNILKDTRLPPQLLCIELTESIFVGQSLKNIRSLLWEIKSLGVATALDDFGTGYSSLSYLEGLPFDKLKIDRAFVRQKQDSQSQSLLLKGIVELAHALNIAVVAEGAETLEEVRRLKALGAESIQGFYFAKPMPEDELFEAVGRIESGKQALTA